MYNNNNSANYDLFLFLVDLVCFVALPFFPTYRFFFVFF